MCFRIREHTEQLVQYGAVRSGEHGLAFFAVKLAPSTQKPGVVLKLFLASALHADSNSVIS